MFNIPPLNLSGGSVVSGDWETNTTFGSVQPVFGAFRGNTTGAQNAGGAGSGLPPVAVLGGLALVAYLIGRKG